NTMGMPTEEVPDLTPFNLGEPVAEPATPAPEPENTDELIDQLSKDFVSKEKAEKPAVEEDESPPPPMI
ncbi:MAG: hypothetical protein QF704_11510, partial [Anaerolineales bacterium]|nr:hypothetical protein [Anaerolineales bacterium]